MADLDVMVLLWPAIDFLDVTFAPFVTPKNMAQAEENGFIVIDGIEVGHGFLNEINETRSVWDDVKQVNVPTLLIHGMADREVPHQQSQQAHKLIKGPKKLVLVDDADHCLRKPAERNAVNAEVVNWFEKYLK